MLEKPSMSLGLSWGTDLHLQPIDSRCQPGMLSSRRPTGNQLGTKWGRPELFYVYVHHMESKRAVHEKNNNSLLISSDLEKVS